MSGISAEPSIRYGAAALAATAALALLLVFYSVVAGAVGHAAERRSKALAEAVALRSTAAAPAAQARYFATRKVSLGRAGD